MAKMKVNKVASGKGAPFASDGSGRNKPAPLGSPDIKKGKQPKIPMKVHSGKSSPLGAKRPTQDGGPRPSQTKGVDFSISEKPSKADWSRTSKDG